MKIFIKIWLQLMGIVVVIITFCWCILEMFALIHRTYGNAFAMKAVFIGWIIMAVTIFSAIYAAESKGKK